MSERPLKNALFCPIPVSDSNFNPRNTKCMDACPIGWLKLSSSLVLDKIKHFSKVSSGFIYTLYNPYLSPTTDCPISFVCSFSMFLKSIILFQIALCLFPNLCHALEPEEILVIANKNFHKSIDMATYYMRKRNIPADNLLKVRVTDKETCSRIDYKVNVAAPVRKYLRRRVRNSYSLSGINVWDSSESGAA